MPVSPRHQLADLLRDVRTGGSFSTRRTTPPDNLTIDVKGVGTIRLPVTAGQAKQLRMLARPARYGKGEETILDRAVRDTWEVPCSRVTIYKRLWANTLQPMLDTVRNDLGLPATSALKAELHSMLVYEPGQFFAAHQDSEKDDRMIGTLIVLLPSRSDGGEFVVEHRGRTATYKGLPIINHIHCVLRRHQTRGSTGEERISRGADVQPHAHRRLNPGPRKHPSTQRNRRRSFNSTFPPATRTKVAR